MEKLCVVLEFSKFSCGNILRSSPRIAGVRKSFGIGASGGRAKSVKEKRCRKW